MCRNRAHVINYVFARFITGWSFRVDHNLVVDTSSRRSYDALIVMRTVQNFRLFNRGFNSPGGRGLDTAR